MQAKNLSVAAACAASFLLTAGAATAGTTFGWSISASDTDPHVNAAVPEEFTMYYLWLDCAQGAGVQAAQFGLSTGNPDVHAFVVPQNGWLNVGDGLESCLLLAGPGCPTGPLVVAAIAVANCGLEPFQLCVVPCDGETITVECGGTAEPMDWVGLDVGGGSCQSGPSPCGLIGTEAMSWGRSKGAYR